MAAMLQPLRRRLGVRLRSAAAVVVAVTSLLAGGMLLVVSRGILLDNINAAALDGLGPG